MIRISSLPLIETQAQFDAASLILLVDVLLVGDIPRHMREYIKSNYGAFIHDKKTYIPITLTGTPDSLLANAGKPIQFKFDRGIENHYTFEGNASALIWQRMIYDLSELAGQGPVSFEREESFIIERYITDRREYIQPQQIENLLSFPKQPSIGTKPMLGLKPVRKN